MAQFNNLGLQEPSTITARVATVTVSRGSTTEHQEIMVLGDPESSNGLARILNTAPASTDWGIVTRPMGYSTTVNVSSLGGVVTVAPQSSAWQVQVTNQSTIVAVSSLGGIVAVRPSDTNWASSAGFHFNSSGELLTKDAGNSTIVSIAAGNSSVIITSGNSSVTVSAWAPALLSSAVVAGNSSALTVRNVWSSTHTDQPVSAAQSGTWNIGTVTTVSSLAGIVSVRPSDTNWASSAGFRFDSSGALQVAGSFSASTTVNVSSLAGRVGIAGWHASGSIVNVTDSTNNAINVNVVAGSAAGSTVATISRFQDSSNNGIAVADSVNNALRVNVVAGAAGGSTIVSISTGSVRVHQSSAADLNVTVAGYSTTANISSLAGNVRVVNSSAADLLVSAVQNGTWSVTASNFSTQVSIGSFASLVSSAVQAGNSSALTVRNVWSSTNTDQPVSAAQAGAWTVRATLSSTSADNPVNAAQAGTWNIGTVTTITAVTTVSSVAGVVTVAPNAGSTWATRPIQSSAADLQTTARLNDGAGNALESSTSAPSSGARGLFVRPILGGITTFSASTVGQSSATTVISSAAVSRGYVFAYSVISTLAGPVEWSIYAGATRLWGGVLAAVSSAVSGANLAVSPPGYLFAGSTGAPLTFNCTSSNAGLNVSIAYWVSP